MNFKLDSKKIPEKVGIFTLMAVLIFGCATNPKSTQVPVVQPTKTSAPSTPQAVKNDSPPVKTFSLQNANKIPPEDIFLEVDFGGQGGQGGQDGDDGDATCNDTEDKYVFQSYPKTDWLEPIYIYTCGWETDEQVKVKMISSNSEVFIDTIKAPKSPLSYVLYMYQGNIDTQNLGQYILKFEGINRVVEVSVDIWLPNESRMYFVENIQAYYLYGFVPEEEIRFFWYEGERPVYYFAGWNNYYMDKSGELLIEVDSNDGYYTVLGSKSGVVGNARDVLRSNPSQVSCPKALPSRLVVGEYAYVATDPPLKQRVREKAKTSSSIVGLIPPGNSMKILDGPKCADGWAWWKVQSIEDPNLVGWTSEGDEVYWLIPCDSLSSCP